jgi:hypothetical protein
MLKKAILHTISLGLMILAIYSCKKQETYPIIPEIKYEDFLLHYNSGINAYDWGVLRITFKDGDGDIGLRQNDVDPPYDFNFFIRLFEIKNGDTAEYIPVVYNPSTQTFDTVTFNQRIPMLTPLGPDKSISGEIEDTLYIFSPDYPLDTIFFEVYIRDRALHKSNTVYTPWMKLGN